MHLHDMWQLLCERRHIAEGKWQPVEKFNHIKEDEFSVLRQAATLMDLKTYFAVEALITEHTELGGHSQLSLNFCHKYISSNHLFV